MEDLLPQYELPPPLSRENPQVTGRTYGPLQLHMKQFFRLTGSPQKNTTRVQLCAHVSKISTEAVGGRRRGLNSFVETAETRYSNKSSQLTSSPRSVVVGRLDEVGRLDLPLNDTYAWKQEDITRAYHISARDCERRAAELNKAYFSSVGIVLGKRVRVEMLADISLAEYRRMMTRRAKDEDSGSEDLTLEDAGTVLQLTALCSLRKKYKPVVPNIFNFSVLIK